MIVLNLALFVMSVVNQYYTINAFKPMATQEYPVEYNPYGSSDFQVRYRFEMEPMELRGFEDSYNRFDEQGRRNGRWIIQKDNKVIISSYRHGKLCGQLIELYNYDGKYRISRIKAYANDSLIIDQSISNYGIGGININIKDNTDFIWPNRYNAPITDPGYQSYVYVFDRDGILEYEGNQIVLDFDDLTGPAEFVGIHKRYWEKGKPVTVEELGFRKSDLNDNK